MQQPLGAQSLQMSPEHAPSSLLPSPSCQNASLSSPLGPRASRLAPQIPFNLLEDIKIHPSCPVAINESKYVERN